MPAVKKWQRTVCSAVFYVFPSGMWTERGSGTGRIYPGYGIYAGTGTRFLSDTVDNIYLYVLYGTGSADDGKSVCTGQSPRENMQRALIQYRRPENRKLVEEALVRAGRQDLIGFGPKCLIRPYDGRRTQKAENLKTQNGHIGNNGKNGRGNQNQQSNGRQQKQHMGKKKTIRNVHKNGNRKDTA